MPLQAPRTRHRVLARNGLLLVLALCVVSAVIEAVLEARDAARLTASATFYTAQGRRIRYHRTGPSSPGPTLILLNGLAASLEEWDGVQVALSTALPVVSYDRGGMGFSDPANAHDAIANADELDQLLQSSEISGPFVLVSYSSSSMLAIVFAARHLDVVKGMVFVDPTRRLPGPGTKTYRQIYWRSCVVNTVEAFFGYTRLKHAIAARNAPPSSPVSERWNAVVDSTHHWLATAHDAMSLDDSADEADAAIAPRPFAHLPLALFTTADPAESEGLRHTFEEQKKLTASSELGVMRAFHGEHTQLLSDPVAIASIVDMVRTIVDGLDTESAGVIYRPAVPTVLASELRAAHGTGKRSQE